MEKSHNILQINCKNCIKASLSNIKFSSKGCCLKVLAECKKCAWVFKWTAQPDLGLKCEGNLLFAAAIVLT